MELLFGQFVRTMIQSWKFSPLFQRFGLDKYNFDAHQVTGVKLLATMFCLVNNYFVVLWRIDHIQAFASLDLKIFMDFVKAFGDVMHQLFYFGIACVFVCQNIVMLCYWVYYNVSSSTANNMSRDCNGHFFLLGVEAWYRAITCKDLVINNILGVWWSYCLMCVYPDIIIDVPRMYILREHGTDVAINSTLTYNHVLIWRLFSHSYE